MANLTETDVTGVQIVLDGTQSPPLVLITGQSVDATGAVLRRYPQQNVWAALSPTVQTRVTTLLANAQAKIKADYGIA